MPTQKQKKLNRDFLKINKIDLDQGWFYYGHDMGRVLAKTKLKSSKRAIIDVVISKTYGWKDGNREETDKKKNRYEWALISYKYFEKFTGIKSDALSKEIDQLIDWKILYRRNQNPDSDARREEDDKGRYEYFFNRKVSEWNRKVFRKIFQDKKWGCDYPENNLAELSNKLKTLPTKSTKKLAELPIKNPKNSSDFKDLESPNLSFNVNSKGRCQNFENFRENKFPEVGSEDPTFSPDSNPFLEEDSENDDMVDEEIRRIMGC